MNIALFGGTFDPVHKGHVAVARAAMANPRFKLERIYFIPADWPPHKQPQAITPYLHRYAMLELALKDEMFFTVSEIEACTPGKPEPNYSIQTVRRFRETLAADDELYFIIGADSFRDLHSWREPKALLKETRMIVVNRPGSSMKEALEGLPEGARLDRISFLEDIAIDISSSSIRATLKRGESADSVLDPLVAEYIRKHRLYV
jgi:nicotinate-nucleotide adenylyltransferase